MIYVGAEKKKYLQASAADNKLDFVVVFLSRAELLRRRRRRRETRSFAQRITRVKPKTGSSFIIQHQNQDEDALKKISKHANSSDI